MYIRFMVNIDSIIYAIDQSEEGGTALGFCSRIKESFESNQTHR